ncbi:hypothetical protein [Microlunatus soli]|uniref:Uncharacterized protein n=1 Tax=Microlunatus soli TaxID=630515 RepID=A0A1H1QES1_9ACTN|nr:hypothetical protein [Microlunatus soli]SDS21399.1 hypothetical protein SAMN04489812_1228 [Microlunatus soli]
MNQLLESARPERSTAASVSALTSGALIAGLVITVAGLGYAVLDQVALHGLVDHLHALYDPVGAYAQPTPLYIYLYSLAGLGVAGWLVTLGLTRSGARSARVVSIVITVLAALAIAPLFLTEYGGPVFPFRLTAWYVVGWLLGLLATITYRPRR